MKIKNDNYIDYGFVAMTGDESMEFFYLKQSVVSINA